MSEHRVEDPAQDSVHGSRVAHWIRRLCVPIVLLWVAIAALTNIGAPQLEVVGAAHSVAQSSPDSPSLQAMMHMVTSSGSSTPTARR
jgi:RND superfamily putative drug exporter